MKKSNKLLIALVLLIFSFPLILLMGFKAALKADRYVVKNNMGYDVYEQKDIKPFAAIKLNGIVSHKDFGLKATISYGTKFSYRINNYNDAHPEQGRLDSCKVSMVGDTLLIGYGLKEDKVHSSGNFFYGIEVEIVIPHVIPVIANAATVDVDTSIARLDVMNFRLFNDATLTMRSVSKDQTIESDGNSSKDSLVYRTVFPGIVINADNASVMIDDRLHIKQLNLNLTGRSTISFTEAVTIDSMNGHISDQSFFNAPYRYSKYLK